MTILRERWFEEYAVGEVRRSIGRTITETDIVLHAGQTGDFFPNHMDGEWMKTQPAGQRVAHGTLTLSIAVGMTADEINTHAVSYGYDRIRFTRPVHIGDTITVSAEITGTRPHRDRPGSGFVDEVVTVTNQRDDVVMILTHIYLVDRRTAAES